MPLVFREAVSVKFLTNNLGLYLHIPFCAKRCKYCNFYSSFATDELLDEYTNALIKYLKQWGGKTCRPIDTIYFGGGTPSLLGKRLPSVLDAVRANFSLLPNAEITLEVNPSDQAHDILNIAFSSGINRLSVGVQSGNDKQLEILGRSHTAIDAVNTIERARKIGFKNISTDLMIGLPFSDNKSLIEDLEFITSLAPDHISAYILKIEEKTAFFKMQDELLLPDDDAQAEQYLLMCEFLKNKGYTHYEISNFAKENKQSRHNTKYWLGEDYLGLGPSAHSALDGKRFFYPATLKDFIKGISPINDGSCGSEEEYIMLRLRLLDGIDLLEYKNIFSKELPNSFHKKCNLFKKADLLKITENKIFLTDKGMLLSNTIISELLECIE